MVSIPPLSPPASYSEPRFREKLRHHARSAGRAVVEKALWLWLAARRPETPRWARATVYGALAYFVMPADAIADLIPGAGYSDDLGVLAFALATVSAHVDDRVRAEAARLLARWFPDLPAP